MNKHTHAHTLRPLATVQKQVRRLYTEAFGLRIAPGLDPEAATTQHTHTHTQRLYTESFGLRTTPGLDPAPRAKLTSTSLSLSLSLFLSLSIVRFINASCSIVEWESMILLKHESSHHTQAALYLQQGGSLIRRDLHEPITACYSCHSWADGH